MHAYSTLALVLSATLSLAACATPHPMGGDGGGGSGGQAPMADAGGDADIVYPCATSDDCKPGTMCSPEHVCVAFECVVPTDCDDGNPCTIDYKGPDGACQHDAAPGGTPCCTQMRTGECLPPYKDGTVTVPGACAPPVTGP